MKKKPKNIGMYFPLFQNNLKLKLTTLLILVVMFNIRANSYAQTKVNLELNNTTVETVLETIEQKTDFRFIYKLNDIDLNRVISIKAKNETIDVVLEKIFKGTSTDFKVRETQVILKKIAIEKEEKVQIIKQTVKGKVVDENGAPLPGASVVEVATNRAASTDANGNFELTVENSNSEILISYVGYRQKKISAAQQNVTIQLLPEPSDLKEVVVQVGYGTVKKKDATGSLTTLKPDALNKGLQANVLDVIVGRIAGVNVIPGSGAPGSTGTIRIRMGASLSANNDPLIIIDGVPVESAALNFINPNDIETYTVLKDASATAIYGSRASNGVVIINTKKGSKNGEMNIAYNSSFTVSEAQGFISNLSAAEYRDVFPKYAIGVPVTFKLGNANTDWQKEIYRTAFGMDHNLSLASAIKETPYRISTGYLNQQGVILENKYERYTLGLSLSPKFLDKHLAVDLNFKASGEYNNPASTGEIGGAISFDPTRPIYEDYPNGMGLGYYMWRDNLGKAIPLSPINPISNLLLTERLSKEKRSIGNVALDYKIHGFEDLHLNMNVGFDNVKKVYNENTPDKAPSMYTSNKNDGSGREYQSENNNKNYIFTTYANYTKDLSEKHNINAMAGYEWQKFWYESNEKVIKGFAAPPYQDEDELYLLSFFGRLNYSFDQKILLTATLRADGSSRFSPENQWGYFPSVALGYKINEENFLKNVKSISNLKFRMSYGQTGQQDIGGFHPYLATYTVSQDPARYQFGDEWVNMYRPNGYDPNIKWETTETYNVGLDFGFFDNRISGSIDVYKRYTEDLLNNIAVPAGSNFTNLIQTNIGNMEGKGAEFALNVIPVKTKDWEWSLGGNFTYSISKISKLNTIDRENSYVKTGTISRQDFQIHKVGEIPNTYFLLRQAYDENGKPLDGKFIAPDGSITTSIADSNKYITGKSSRAPYYYGFNTRLIYKNLDFGMNGHGSFGNYILNYQEASKSLSSLYGGSAGISSNISHATLEKGFTQSQVFSDIYLEDGAFFKFDNITVGYTMEKLSKTIKSLRFAFSLQNIATITDYSGLDPEIFNGLDNNIYQRPKIYTLSLNANF
ncbi:SusC/RagA family TonB-linked outer membrane protein [Flavobacterium sp.]|jgi:iron complex outermembrane receptor protein|uniref:SusC/RagA family TonB-linked outer membrane protein n=1 Tax=Flavobacterium sp. TaxID=239 RepID=UPI0037C0F543